MGGIAFALFYSGPRHPDRLARRPQEPGQHHRRVGGPVERVHRRLRAGAEFLAIVPGADGGRHRRGGRRRAVLRARSPISTRKEKRARALAFFSLGIPIGSALGVFFGGWIASHLDWRSAFLIVGLAGLPAALLVKLGIPEPVRGGFDSADGAASEPAPPFADVAATLARTPSFWLLSFGAASGSILGYGLIFWLPSFFSRSFGLELAEVGWFYGSIVLVGGVAGTWLGGWLGDRTGPGNPGAYARVPAICFLIAAPGLRARPVRAVAARSAGCCSRSARCWRWPGSGR